MRGITEAYDNAETSTARRTILSMIAPKVSFSILRLFIPGITHYRFVDARMYGRQVAAGSNFSSGPRVFQRFDEAQVQHFVDFITSGYVCTDMPFGEKLLKLTDGTILHVPDTIRNCDSSRIITQYYRYSNENFSEFSVLGQSTLYKILKECKASSRKSIQGLNYFAANGSEAFDALYDLVNNLHLDVKKSYHLIENLKRAKQYLKTDYKINIKRSSSVADHCITFSLSDPNNVSFSHPCNDHHDHSQVCLNCINLTRALDDVRNAIEIANSNEEENERLKFRVHLATQSILAWKSHQLRTVNQDLGRQSIFKIIGEDSVHLNMDFAMK